MFIYKTLIMPSFLDSCFISSMVYEVKSAMLRLDFKICAKDKNFSSIWTYMTMMLPRVRNHHGGKCVHRDLVEFDKMVEAASKFQNLLKIGMLVWGKLHELGEENSEDIFSFGSALEDFICVVFVHDRNIASDYDNSGPVPQLQNVSHSADTTVPSQQELDLLFGPLYDEFFTAEPTNPTNVNAEENNNNQAEVTQFQQDEFINPFCTPVREIAESSSRNIDNSNMHTFYQPRNFKYRWTTDHPLEQVHGNPSKPVQTRRQLATNPEICMFALTVSTAEPKTIKEAMADSAWIEAMQEELHQFDRLQVWELTKTFG
ncbi:hypothetical protein Tco_0904788 [Tanacetum coccineum]